MPFLLILAFAFWGCAAVTAPESGEAFLSLSFGAIARAFAPEEAEVASYALTATSSKGETVSSSSVEASQTLKLPAGSWTIRVEGLSTGGLRLVAGSISLDLEPGERRSAAIVLLPEGGAGSMALSWTTTGSPSGALLVKGELCSIDGKILPLEAAGASGSLILPDIPSGSWSLSLTLENEAGRLAGLADSILIVSGFETKVSVLFEPPLATLTLALIAPSFAAETLTTSPPLRRVALGEAGLFAIPATAGPGSWYRDGSPLGSSQSEVAVVASYEGISRIDWVSNQTNIAKSASAGLLASPAAQLGPLSWKETLIRSDFGTAASAKGLDGCRDLVFGPDGETLLLAGRDGNAVSDLALPGGSSPLARTALLSSDIPGLAAVQLACSIPGSSNYLALGTSLGALVPLRRGIDGSLSAGAPLILADFASASALEVCPGSAFAWIASEEGNSVIRVELDSDGRPISTAVAIKAGEPGFELFSRPSSLAISPDGGYLAIGSSGDDAIWYCTIDPSSGNLSLLWRLGKADIAAVASLSDPVDLVFSPDGASLFALSYYGKSLIRFDRDSSDIWQASGAAKSGTAPYVGFDYPKRLALSPDGKILVVSGGGASDGLAAFSTALPGSLDWIGALLPDGSDSHPAKPGALAFSPDGSRLVAASPEDDSVYFFALSLP
ncbi:MAG TPA: beta-propeller fold lactonase family protein [Rectinemataceae bacterium]|nr:beta-propeller fold lactonase family protein [Rectinemataceae bacterium]